MHDRLDDNVGMTRIANSSLSLGLQKLPTPLSLMVNLDEHIKKTLELRSSNFKTFTAD